MGFKKFNLSDFSDIALNISVAIFVFFASVFCLSSFGFIFKFPINISYPIISVVLAFGVLGYRCIKVNRMSVLKTIFAFFAAIILVALCALFAFFHWDSTYDGRSYHQSTAMFLSMGWNPVWFNVDDFVKRFSYKFSDMLCLLWSQNYPKFSEIIAANIYKLTNELEIGKIFNILSASGLFLYIFYVLDKHILEKKSAFLKFFASFLFILNPIVITQAFTYYIDGLLYLYFILFLFVITDIEYNKTISKTDGFLLGFSILALLNIKFSGLLYSIFLLGGYMAYLYIKKRNYILSYKKIVLITILISSLTLIKPYVYNVISGKTIFYPLTGKEKLDNITYNMPKQFMNKNMFYKFFYSTFSKTANHNSDAVLKVPLTVHEGENVNFYYPDARIGGFGVFFSGILLLSLLQLFFIRPKEKETRDLNIFILTILFLSVLLNPHNWWARYIPQFWAFVVFINIFALSGFNKFEGKIKYLSFFVLLLMFLNSFAVFIKSLEYSLLHTIYEKRQFNIMSQINQQKELLLHTKNGLAEFGYMVLLDKYNIKYKFVDDEFYMKHKNMFKEIPHSLEGEGFEWNY